MNISAPVVGTMVGYFVLLLSVGFVFKRFVGDGLDFFKSGSRASWWMVGTSIFMAGFSAWTFTGAAGMAYTYGWSVLGIFVMVPFALLIQALFFARRFRRLRATTVPELIRFRFDRRTQQVYAGLTVFQYIFIGAIQLYALSIFISSFFSLPVFETTLVLGFVIGVYIILGGSWAALGADTLQAFLVVGVVFLVAMLSLNAVGGLDGLFDTIRIQGLEHDFRFLKEAGEVDLGNFSLFWLLAMGTLYLFEGASFANAVKYFSVKDDRHATAAACFAMVLAMLGALIWFIPPMVARLLFSDIVDASPLARPEEGAFAVAALQLLPPSMWGLLAVAVTGATVSSMDTTINRNSAILVRDIAPALSGKFPWLIQGSELLRGRIFSCILCVLMVVMALFYNQLTDFGIFDLLQRILSMVALPMTIPLALGMLIRRTPAWSALVTCGAGLCVSGVVLISEFMGADPWTFSESVFRTAGVCVLVFLLTIPFSKTQKSEYSERVTQFFELMRKPVDFANEIGHANDREQLRAMAILVLSAAAFLSLLNVVAEQNDSMGWFWGLASVFWMVGAAMFFGSRMKHKH
ncbi:sodium:solute symporter family transporter [Coraliomargarita sp. W4R72]